MQKIPYSSETKATVRAECPTQTLLRAKKKLIVVRGLPGSGKTSYCVELMKASFTLPQQWVHCEVDMMPASNVDACANDVIEQFEHGDVVMLDGIFPEKQVVMSIYTKVKDAVGSVGLDVVTPRTPWASNPYQCWMKTVERAADSHPDDSSRRKLVPLKSVMDLWKRWEDVSFPGTGAGSQ